eukprot:1715664-Pleurochrysis_carterae.AAC.1
MQRVVPEVWRLSASCRRSVAPLAPLLVVVLVPPRRIPACPCRSPAPFDRVGRRAMRVVLRRKRLPFCGRRLPPLPLAPHGVDDE